MPLVLCKRWQQDPSRTKLLGVCCLLPSLPGCCPTVAPLPPLKTPKYIKTKTKTTPSKKKERKKTHSVGAAPGGGGYSLGKLLCMCGPRRECPQQRIAKKAPIIGANFAKNPPIMGQIWVILKENGHFVPKVKAEFSQKYP